MPNETHDLSAESTLMSLLFGRPQALLPELRARLRPTDLYSHHHALLYQAMLELDETGAVVDAATVFARMEKKADSGLSPAELKDYRDLLATPLAPGSPEEADVERLLGRVLARARSRELVRRLEGLLEDARRSPEDLRLHVDEALASLLPLARELGAAEGGDLASLAERLRHVALRRPTGWSRLDALDTWIAGGELALVLGRTVHGKTNFMLNLALNWLEQAKDDRFLFFTLEMRPEQLAKRLLAMRVPGSLGSPPWGDRLAFRYAARLDVERVVAESLRRLGGRKPGAVFVDSLTSLAPPPQARFQGRRDLELDEVCRRLKELSVALDCPVVAAVPASRSALKETGTPLRELLAKGAEYHDPQVEDALRARRPRLEHLPESGLEQQADLVVGLQSFVADYQEELDPEHRQVFRQKPSGGIEVNALKYRSGALQGVELEMDMRTGRIWDGGGA